MSKSKRKLTSQAKKLTEVLNDALTELELLQIDGASTNIKKGLTIVGEIQTDNENRRDGDE